MGCSCINQIFDLSVTDSGPTKMVIEDQSTWMDEPGYEQPVTFDINIRSLTNRGINKTIPLFVNRRNILTAKDLGLKGECIKDDLYCFSVKSCGVPMSITRAFLPNAECVWHTLNANQTDQIDQMNADDVKRLIGIIESQIILDRAEQAKETYKVLTDKIKGLNCECCN